MSRPLGCVIACLLVIGASSCLAMSLSFTKKPVAVLSDISEVSVRYTPDELFEKLGFTIVEQNSEYKYVAHVLAATDDKERPKSVLNQHSINDLLAMNEVYESDFSRERFQQKLAFCDSLKPDEKSLPEDDVLASLLRRDRYFRGEKTDSERGEREPHEYMYRKNLYDYCKKAFENYHRTMRERLMLEFALQRRVKRLQDDVERFCGRRDRPIRMIQWGNYRQSKEVMRDFLKEKSPKEVAKIMETCSSLVDKVGFVGDLALDGYKSVPGQYDFVFNYCMGALEP